MMNENNIVKLFSSVVTATVLWIAMATIFSGGGQYKSRIDDHPCEKHEEEFENSMRSAIGMLGDGEARSFLEETIKRIHPKKKHIGDNSICRHEIDFERSTVTAINLLEVGDRARALLIAELERIHPPEEKK